MEWVIFLWVMKELHLQPPENVFFGVFERYMTSCLGRKQGNNDDNNLCASYS